MTNPHGTRSKSKKQVREDITDGATNSPEFGTTTHNNNNDQGEEQGNPTNATSSPTIADIISKELPNSNLSGEMLSLVNIISKVIQTQFDMYFSKLNSLNNAKDQHIATLESKITVLEDKVTKLEDSIDDVDQYERRDTVIISGPSLPEESTHENAADIIVNTIKHNLHVNMQHSDINIAHRLGQKTQGKKRPIIVKLQNRAKKSELVHACITVRPRLSINESLTPKRRAIYSTIRQIRSQHTHLFQQCYTADGKIIVKLRNSSNKYVITSEQTLATFLDKHPLFRDAARATTENR